MRLAEILARTLIGLQQQAGCSVKFARVAETWKTAIGVCKIAVQYCEEPVGRMALTAAFELVQAAIDGREFDAASRESTRSAALTNRFDWDPAQAQSSARRLLGAFRRAV